MTYDLIIIGLGPAGVSASIYAKRAGLNVLVIEASMPGGLVNNTMAIDNYPGFEKISGPDLAMKFYEHFLSMEIPLKNKRVVEIIDEEDYRVIKTEKEEFKTKKVIIATGRKPRKLGLENETKLLGKGISYCAICDAPLYKKKNVAVIGAGNSALEEAIYLSDIVNKVYLIHRNESLRGDRILVDKISEIDNIELVYNSNVTAFNEEDGVLKSITINDENKIDVACVFIYIGYEPALDFINDLIETNHSGYIKVNDNYETNLPGVYAVGDIIQKKYYQIVTAVSEGAVAALNASASLKRHK